MVTWPLPCSPGASKVAWVKGGLSKEKLKGGGFRGRAVVSGAWQKQAGSCVSGELLLHFHDGLHAQRHRLVTHGKSLGHEDNSVCRILAPSL